MLRVCSGGTRAGGAQLCLLTFGRKQEACFCSALRSINTKSEEKISMKNENWSFCPVDKYYMMIMHQLYSSFLVMFQLLSHKTAVV